MPLLDHFRPPLADRYPWRSFAANWASRIADVLVAAMPEQFQAEEYVQTGKWLNHDIGAEELADTAITVNADGMHSTPATMIPNPAYSIPTVFPNDCHVLVYELTGGRRLVGAIELVNPSNKDRPDMRQAFAAKCASYLHQGVSVIILDTVTTCPANLHNETMRLMGVAAPVEMPADTGSYAVAYRPVLRDERPEIDLWPAPVALGEPLPTLPLRLTGDLFVPVEFEAAYQEACRSRGLA
jgi:hypothetical protein